MRMERARNSGHCTRITPPQAANPEHATGSTRLQRCGALPIILVLVLGVCACVDLTSVTEFAKCSKDLGNSFRVLADETLATCRGSQDFAPSGTTPLDCTEYKSIEPRLTAVNDVLFDYIASLGKLAGPVSDSNPFKDVASQLKEADPSMSQSDQKEASAAGGLFSALTQVLLSGYQQRRLISIIRDTNDSVQNVVAFLSGYAADQSAEMIRNSWTLENEFCVGQPQVASGEPLATKLLRIKCDDDAARKEAKLAAVKKYQDGLKVVAETHARLSDPKNWNTKDLVKYLGPQIAQLSDAVMSMRKAFH